MAQPAPHPVDTSVRVRWVLVLHPDPPELWQARVLIDERPDAVRVTWQHSGGSIWVSRERVREIDSN